jgi:hypothetical protein
MTPPSWSRQCRSLGQVRRGAFARSPSRHRLYNAGAAAGRLEAQTGSCRPRDSRPTPALSSLRATVMCDRGLHKGDRDQAALRRRLFSARHRVPRQGATTIAPSRIWPTLHVKGYSAPETKAAAERAHLLIEQDKPFGPQRRYWVRSVCFFIKEGQSAGRRRCSVSWACAESVAKRRKLRGSGPDRKHLPGKHVKHSVELVRRAVDERNCREVASKATRKRKSAARQVPGIEAIPHQPQSGLTRG